MDPIEEKKWKIQRIDAVFQLNQDWIIEDRDKIQNLKQKEIDRYDQLGKGVIGTVAFIITVLLGLSTYGLKFDLVFGIGWIAAIGLWIYTLISIFKLKNEKLFDKLLNSSRTSTSMIYYVMGYFHKNSMSLELFTAKDYENFHLFFVYYTVPALDIGECQFLKKLLKSKFDLIFVSIPARKQLTERFESKNNFIGNAAIRYEEEKDQYESDDFLDDMVRFGDYLLDYKNGKYVVFSTTKTGTN